MKQAKQTKQKIPMKIESLIKYSSPFLVSVVNDKNNEFPIDQSQYLQLRTEELLNIIIKPLEFRLENNQLWRQTVLSTPATKTEVINLEEQLDKKLLSQEAKEHGICNIRQQLYDECFDELIRQITIDCKQRGLLLVKVRDEVKRQMNAYNKIYESSVAFGLRKIVDKSSYKIELQKQIEQLKREESELQSAVNSKQQLIMNFKVQQEQLLQQKEQDHHLIMQDLKAKNLEIKNQMDSLLARS